MDRGPALTDPQRREAVRRWAELFNGGAYYEAHEAAEEAWLRVPGPERAFFKGLVHAAVSLCHWQRGNPHGGQVKCASAIAYLEPFAPEYEGLDLAGLLGALREFAEWMEGWDPGASSRFPDPPPRASLLPAP